MSISEAVSLLRNISPLTMSASLFIAVLVIGALLVSSSGHFCVQLVVLTWSQIEAYRTNFPPINGIPEVPNALPFIGHLLPLGGRTGRNDCSVFSAWASQLNANVFQCVLGNQRTIVVSDWATMKSAWVAQSHSLSDRPHQPGFVDKLGIDLTGFPMTDQIRKCRAAGMRALSKVVRTCSSSVSDADREAI